MSAGKRYFGQLPIAAPHQTRIPPASSFALPSPASACPIPDWTHGGSHSRFENQRLRRSPTSLLRAKVLAEARHDSLGTSTAGCGKRQTVDVNDRGVVGLRFGAWCIAPQRCRQSDRPPMSQSNPKIQGPSPDLRQVQLCRLSRRSFPL
jgi:hypothetical protein